MVATSVHSTHVLCAAPGEPVDSSESRLFLSSRFTEDGCTIAPDEGDGECGRLAELGEDNILVSVAFKSARLNLLVPA